MVGHVNKKVVQRLAHLAKIGFSESEEEKFLPELEGILEYVSLLHEVDTDGVEPLFYVIEGNNATPLRDDIPSLSLTTDDFLSQAPDQTAQMVRVPKFQK